MKLGFILYVVWAVLCGSVLAQPLGRSMDAQIIHGARLIASSGKVDVFEHGISIDPGLAAIADRALAQMEALLGRTWDAATLGARVRIYISAETRVSHVLGGYEHQNNPVGVLLLSPMVARLALIGSNATYAHELAHLLTWRFYSHTLREGLADYVALQLHPGAVVGPNRDGYASFAPVPAGVSELLGSVAGAPSAVTQDIQFRQSYYASSYRFVRYLVEQGGLPKFMELYAKPDPESAYVPMYGKDRSTLVAEALR